MRSAGVPRFDVPEAEGRRTRPRLLLASPPRVLKGHDAGHTPDLWVEEFRRNVARDAQVKKVLKATDWRVLVVWEYQTKDARAWPDFFPSAPRRRYLPYLFNSRRLKSLRSI
jgi:hypothetical protein